MKDCGNSAHSSVLQLDHGDPAAALIGRGQRELLHQRVIAEELRQRPPQLPGAVPVDQANLAHFGEQRLVEELIGPFDRFRHGAPDHVQVVKTALRARRPSR